MHGDRRFPGGPGRRDERQALERADVVGAIPLRRDAGAPEVGGDDEVPAGPRPHEPGPPDRALHAVGSVRRDRHEHLPVVDERDTRSVGRPTKAVGCDRGERHDPPAVRRGGDQALVRRGDREPAAVGRPGGTTEVERGRADGNGGRRPAGSIDDEHGRRVRVRRGDVRESEARAARRERHRAIDGLGGRHAADRSTPLRREVDELDLDAAGAPDRDGQVPAVRVDGGAGGAG